MDERTSRPQYLLRVPSTKYSPVHLCSPMCQFRELEYIESLYTLHIQLLFLYRVNVRRCGFNIEPTKAYYVPYNVYTWKLAHKHNSFVYSKSIQLYHICIALYIYNEALFATEYHPATSQKPINIQGKSRLNIFTILVFRDPIRHHIERAFDVLFSLFEHATTLHYAI